jgi:UDP-glucose 4-epimerase
LDTLKTLPTSVKRVLITGGAGFIGSHLTEALLARGDAVTVIDDESTGREDNLSAVRAHERLTFRRGSVSDIELVRQSLEGASEVYHLAAAVGVALIAKQPLQTIERNIYPTQLLLDELCRKSGSGQKVRFFLASTSEVYGKNPKAAWTEEDDLVFGPTTRPRWSYGVSKAVDEFLALACARQFGLPVVIGRFFNVVGPRQTGAYGMVLPRFVDAALAGECLIVHDDGRQVRCFAHVKDVVAAVVKLMETPAAAGHVYNIGSDQPVSILELAQRVVKLADSPSPIEYQSYAQAYDSDFEDIRHRVPELTRLRQTIGFAPRNDLDAIIRDVIAWKRIQRA